MHFDSEFANIVLMYAIMSQGRLKLLRGQLAFHYSRAGYQRLDFLHRNTDFYQDILQCVMDLPEVRYLAERTIDQATGRNEWTTLSHDGTYKLAKSLIVETNHGGQGRAGPVKVVHTLRGMSGASPGVSIQEGRVARHVSQRCEKYSRRPQCRSVDFSSPSMWRISYPQQLALLGVISSTFSQG